MAIEPTRAWLWESLARLRGVLWDNPVPVARPDPPDVPQARDRRMSRIHLVVPLLMALAPAAWAQDLRQASRKVDQLVESGLREAGLRPNAEVDDETRVRRTFLVVAGRAPTLAELDRWASGARGAGHDDLVEELLGSPSRVSHAFNEWADVLRVQSRFGRRVSGEPYMHFVKDALAQNVPYDEWVREMLTAEGAAHEGGNGATGYWLRDFEMPLDAMSNTMRVFLGTRMECAQCHDHPFEDWTQRQFFELAAFNGGMRYSAFDPRSATRGADRERAEVVRDFVKTHGANARGVVRRVVQDQAVGLSGDGDGTIRLPKDYAYDDARPNSIVRAQVPFGPPAALPSMPEVAPVEPGARGRGRRALDVPSTISGSRQAFASWLTSPENPRFTTVIVNRIWRSTFGLGLIEPVDDLRDDTVAVYPELQSYLEELMRNLGYDLVAFQSVLLNTRLFRRGAAIHDDGAEEPFRFQGPTLRRMSAEQVWDTLLGLAIGDADRTLRPLGEAASPIYANHARIASLDAEGLRRLLDEEMLRFTDRPAYVRLLAARRASMSGTTTSSANRAAELRDRIVELSAELRRARRSRDQDELARVTRALAQARRDAAAEQFRRDPQLVRASELRQPAPPGHFVREWGQSDREQISSSSSEANVPQALQLINGVVDEKLLAAGSALRNALEANTDPKERVSTAFRAILGRGPTSAEGRMWTRALEDEGAEGVVDLVWTLVNSHEFRFVQ